MASTTTTRELAKAAALEILRRGERPTAEKVRAVVGRGAQQTILSALDEFWADLGERVCEPRLPAAVVDAAAALWSGALTEAARVWDGERADGAARVADLTAAVAALRAERAGQEAQLEAVQGDHRQLTQRLDDTTATLGATRQAVAELQDRVQELEGVEAALRADLATERAGRVGDQTTWLQQVDETRQRLKAAEGALAKTQGAFDQVREAEAAQRAELARTTQRGADLERQLQEQVAAGAALHTRLDDQAGAVQGLRAALATATREREQAASAAAQADAEGATLRARCEALEQERYTHLAQLAAGSAASAEAARALRRDLQDLLRPVLEQRHPTAVDDPVAGTPP
jgi:chromosome segregation ATPase